MKWISLVSTVLLACFSSTSFSWADTPIAWEYQFREKGLWSELPPEDELPGYSIGNESVFGEVGAGYPINQVHRLRFPKFKEALPSQYSLQPIWGWFDWKYATRSGSSHQTLHAPVVMTRETFQKPWPWSGPLVQVRTETFALDTLPVILRKVTVSLAEDSEDPLEDFRFELGFDSEESSQVGSNVAHARDSGVIHVPVLEAGQSWEMTTAIVFAAEGEDTSGLYDQIDSRSYEEWRSETWAAWKRRLDQGVRYGFEGKGAERAQAFLINARLQTLIRQSPDGAIADLGESGKLEVRQSTALVKYLLSSGFPEEAKRLVKALYASAVRAKGIFPTYQVSYESRELPPNTARSYEEWLAGPINGEYEAVGTPSHLIHQWKDLLSWGAIREVTLEEYDYLKASLFGQLSSKNEEGLYPMAGDEEWKLIQAGVSLRSAWKYFWRGDRFSAASHFWLTSSAQKFAEIASEFGSPTDREEAIQLAQETRQSTRKHFWSEFGFYYSPFLMPKLFGGLRAASLPVSPIQYEALWSEFLSRKTLPQWSEARLNFLATLGWLDRRWDLFPSTPHFYGKGHEVWTGNEPGLLLWNMKKLNHPALHRGQENLLRALTPNGTLASLQWRESFGRAIPADVQSTTSIGPTALAAFAFQYSLFGVEPKLEEGRLQVHLRPSLPDQWRRVEVQGIQVANQSLDLSYSQDSGRLALIVERKWGEGEVEFPVELDLPKTLAEKAILRSVRVNGEEVEWRATSEWDQESRQVHLSQPATLGERDHRLTVELDYD